jgi:hypothetical protein
MEGKTSLASSQPIACVSPRLRLDQVRTTFPRARAPPWLRIGCTAMSPCRHGTSSRLNCPRNSWMYSRTLWISRWLRPRYVLPPFRSAQPTHTGRNEAPRARSLSIPMRRGIWSFGPERYRRVSDGMRMLRTCCGSSTEVSRAVRGDQTIINVYRHRR